MLDALVVDDDDDARGAVDRRGQSRRGDGRRRRAPATRLQANRREATAAGVARTDGFGRVCGHERAEGKAAALARARAEPRDLGILPGLVAVRKNRRRWPRARESGVGQKKLFAYPRRARAAERLRSVEKVIGIYRPRGGFSSRRRSSEESLWSSNTYVNECGNARSLTIDPRIKLRHRASVSTLALTH